mmetsp:Transcript_9109/g.22580  ORF Transcript_9109/g.22580 Transcript_9109/m.22580 type:complete len:235 (-) Transcript_9109:122-826(-)
MQLLHPRVKPPQHPLRTPALRPTSMCGFTPVTPASHHPSPAHKCKQSSVGSGAGQSTNHPNMQSLLAVRSYTRRHSCVPGLLGGRTQNLAQPHVCEQRQRGGRQHNVDQQPCPCSIQSHVTKRHCTSFKSTCKQLSERQRSKHNQKAKPPGRLPHHHQHLNICWLRTPTRAARDRRYNHNCWALRCASSKSELPQSAAYVHFVYVKRSVCQMYQSREGPKGTASNHWGHDHVTP